MAVFVFDERDAETAAPRVPPPPTPNQHKRPELGFPSVGFQRPLPHSQLHPVEYVSPSSEESGRELWLG